MSEQGNRITPYKMAYGKRDIRHHEGRSCSDVDLLKFHIRIQFHKYFQIAAPQPETAQTFGLTQVVERRGRPLNPSRAR